MQAYVFLQVRLLFFLFPGPRFERPNDAEYSERGLSKSYNSFPGYPGIPPVSHPRLVSVPDCLFPSNTFLW